MSKSKVNTRAEFKIRPYKFSHNSADLVGQLSPHPLQPLGVFGLRSATRFDMLGGIHSAYLPECDSLLLFLQQGMSCFCQVINGDSISQVWVSPAGLSWLAWERARSAKELKTLRPNELQPRNRWRLKMRPKLEHWSQRLGERSQRVQLEDPHMMVPRGGPSHKLKENEKLGDLELAKGWNS